MNGFINPLKTEIYFDRRAFKIFVLVGRVLYLHDKDQSVSDVTEVINLYSENCT